MRLLPLAAIALGLLVTACGSSTAPSTSPDDDRTMRAVSVLPPGQSGLVTTEGQLSGSASGEPSDFGEHLDDQRLMYWDFQYKPGELRACGDGGMSAGGRATIEFDAFGVPLVCADSEPDLLYGVGQAMAMQRLFLMDAARRLARGTFAELAGCGAVPEDIQTRTLTYSNDEYMSFFEQLDADLQVALQAFVEGINDRIEDGTTSEVGQLPAEYTLLTTSPASFDVIPMRLLSGLVFCIVPLGVAALEFTPEEILSQWDRHSFQGETHYERVELDGQAAIHAVYDAVTESGLVVEIKATQSNAVAFRSQPQHAIIIKIMPDGTFEEIYNGPEALVWEQFKDKRIPINGQFQVSIAKLSKFNRSVTQSDRVPKAV